MKNLFLILALLTVSACTKKHSAQQKEWITHGDPKQLVVGTELNKGFAAYPANFKFENLYLVGSDTFIDKSEKISIEKEFANAAPQANPLYDESRVFHTPVSLVSSDPIRLERIVGDDVYTIVLSKTDTHIQFTELNLNGKPLPIDTNFSHISFDKASNKMSLQIYGVQNGFKYLNVLIYGPKVFTPPAKLNELYNYLGGPGVGVRWDKSQALRFTDCTSVSPVVSEAIQKGLIEWSNALRAKLKISLNKTKCPPFSDLHTHGVYYIKDFSISMADGYSIYATAMTYMTDSMIDTDMFLYDLELFHSYKLEIPDTRFTNYEEVLKAAEDPQNSKLRSSEERFLLRHILHELGHMLGLAHIFDGTISIMSYNNKPKDPGLTDYDKAAIQELYK